MKIFREMVRSTAMGADAIDHLMPYVEDEGLMQVMRKQRETLHGFLCTAKGELTADEAEEAEGGKLSKTMLKASSTVSAMLNSDTSHLARMLIEGYETGIVSMQKCVNEMQKEHFASFCDSLWGYYTPTPPCEGFNPSRSRGA